MNRGRLLFAGILIAFAGSWFGLVLLPQLQLGRLEAVEIEETGEIYPPILPGNARRGREVYRAHGCIYCHSQQVRPPGFGADSARHWGPRRTVARDYLRDQPVLLGTMRTGPDLANAGLRQTNAAWHLLHLYSPALASPGSIMPPFRFLFETRKAGADRSAGALDLPTELAPPAGCEVIPKPAARDLVDYLLNLKAAAPLPEAK